MVILFTNYTILAFIEPPQTCRLFLFYMPFVSISWIAVSWAGRSRSFVNDLAIQLRTRGGI